MKIKREWIAGVAAFLLIGGQAYYFYSVHPIKKAELEMTQSEISIKRKQLETLERQYVQLEETKEELEVTTLQVAATKDRLPAYTAASKDMVDMLIMMENGSFSDIEVQAGAEEVQVIAEQDIIKLGYQLQFVAPFNKVRQTIEHLKSSYQMLQIHSFNVNNAPQVDIERYEDKYKQDMHQLVQAQLDFSVFARPDAIEDLYESTANPLTNPANAFLNREATEEKKQEAVTDPSWPSDEETSTAKPDSIPSVSTVNQFELNVYDILVSGDTHRFTGPNGDEKSLYTGVATDEDVKMTLNLWEDRYELFTETANGKVNELKGQLTKNASYFKITSYAGVVNDKIAHTSVYINNYTNQVVEVKVQGQNLGNIHILNELGQEVPKGQTKGKVKVD